MSKYLERINKDKDAKAAAANELSAVHAKASVEQKISQLTAAGATLSAAYEAALSTTPFSIEKVFSLTAEMKANSDNLALAKSILTTEF